MNEKTKGNKGEWSEPYVILKLLSDGFLSQGAIAGEKAGKPYKVLAVCKNEKSGADINHKIYRLNGAHVSLSVDGVDCSDILTSQFTKYAEQLFKDILKGKGASFSVSQPVTQFLDTINCKQLKASSRSKADINIVVHDCLTGTNPNLGFSVKSQLGSPSTLINASIDNTNFRYFLRGRLTKSQAQEINSISSRKKIQDRIQAIKGKGVSLEFDRVVADSYRNNLLLLDTDLARIMAECLILKNSGESSDLKSLVKLLTEANPLKYPNVKNVPYYAFKLKKFLLESALGMMPNTPWEGVYDASGGYIIVKIDGELVSYHLLRKNFFEDYLLSSTRLDSPGSKRHKYGKIYFDGDQAFFNLNLQVRFKPN